MSSTLSDSLLKLNSIASVLEAYQSGSITTTQLVTLHLNRLKSIDSKLAVILTPMPERALAQAAKIDADRAAGKDLGLLAGIPFVAKDMFLIDGVRTTAASQILDQFIAPYTATAVTKLEAAGAICLAKVNQDEFAHGGSTEYSGYHPSYNPHDLSRVPGGSSGGSAAALAAGVGLFAIGTDTGGSIRQPAAYCGVVGYKPTYGLISRYGVVAMASSFDVIGPFANNAADAALVTKVMAGQDENDATTITSQFGHEYESEVDNRPESKAFKVAIIEQYLDGLEPAIKAIYDQAFDKLKATGWEIETISLPDLASALACYYVLTPAEISSNLERYDGIRFGASSPEAINVDQAYAETRGQKFGPEVQRRILTGTYALSAGYYDAYYKKAMQVRTLISQGFNQAFQKYDLLIGPTTPTPAFKLGANTADPVAMYLADIMTVAANLTGIPAISIPLAGPDNLPIGLQIMAAQKSDSLVLSAASQAEGILNTKLAEVSL